jgi:hypothetical protein
MVKGQRQKVKVKGGRSEAGGERKTASPLNSGISRFLVLKIANWHVILAKKVMIWK